MKLNEEGIGIWDSIVDEYGEPPNPQIHVKYNPHPDRMMKKEGALTTAERRRCEREWEKLKDKHKLEDVGEGIKSNADAEEVRVTGKANPVRRTRVRRKK
jgi:hypothetical protein